MDSAEKSENPKMRCHILYFSSSLQLLPQWSRQMRLFNFAPLQSKAPESTSSAHLTLTPTSVARSFSVSGCFPLLFSTYFSYSFKLLYLFWYQGANDCVGFCELDAVHRYVFVITYQHGYFKYYSQGWSKSKTAKSAVSYSVVFFFTLNFQNLSTDAALWL